jgi:hypothetical protein
MLVGIFTLRSSLLFVCSARFFVLQARRAAIDCGISLRLTEHDAIAYPIAAPVFRFDLSLSRARLKVKSSWPVISHKVQLKVSEHFHGSVELNAAMPRRVFTPATIQLIRELALQGKSAAEVAGRIGSTPASIRVRCSQHKIKLGRRGRPSLRHAAAQRSGVKKLLIRMDAADLVAFKRKAAQMGRTPTELASALLETIVTSDLFKAVLGDD